MGWWLAFVAAAERGVYGWRVVPVGAFFQIAVEDDGVVLFGAALGEFFFGGVFFVEVFHAGLECPVQKHDESGDGYGE